MVTVVPAQFGSWIGGHSSIKNSSKYHRLKQISLYTDELTAFRINKYPTYHPSHHTHPIHWPLCREWAETLTKQGSLAPGVRGSPHFYMCSALPWICPSHHTITPYSMTGPWLDAVSMLRCWFSSMPCCISWQLQEPMCFKASNLTTRHKCPAIADSRDVT